MWNFYLIEKFSIISAVFALRICFSAEWKISTWKRFAPVSIRCFTSLQWLPIKCSAWHFRILQRYCCCKCSWNILTILASFRSHHWIIELVKIACGTISSTSINFIRLTIAYVSYWIIYLINPNYRNVCLRFQCMVWSWILSIELHFFIVASIILLILKNHPRYGIIIFSSFLISSLFANTALRLNEHQSEAQIKPM